MQNIRHIGQIITRILVTLFILTPVAALAVIINEVDSDQASIDSAEFIELYDGGTGNTDLTGMVLVLYNGSDNLSYLAFDLDGQSTNAEGYFVLCGDAANTANCDLDVSPNTNLIQNGEDAVALLMGDAVNYPNNTALPADADIVDAIVYETGSDTDSELLVLLNSGQNVVNEGGNGDQTGHSNQRCANGSGGARNTDTYTQAAPTPGITNDCVAPPPPSGFCGDAATKIWEIQGSGAASTLVGSSQIIEGIVVGDFQLSTELNGFHIQEEDSDTDSDTSTSDGIFVYNPGGTEVNIGDVVRVQGNVAEFSGLTELTDISSVQICFTGNNVTPTSISLPSDLETVEGMAVILASSLNIAEFYNYDRYGEMVLTSERQFQSTAIYAPGSTEQIALALSNALDRITLDDGSTAQNPEQLRHPDGSDFDLNNLFRGGDKLSDVAGVMHFAFGIYRIHPTQNAQFTPENTRPSAPDYVGSSLTVGSFNVLNYFTTLDDAGNICGPSASSGCRGADNADEFTRQRDKIINAIVTMDADIVGLIEIENHVNDSAVIDLLSGLNALAGAGTYAAISTGTIGTDAIKVGLIYQPDSVLPSGTFAVLDASVDSTFIDDKNRPVLAQTFELVTNGAKFTVAVNHFKAKGSSCSSINDPDLNDGQGNCNLTRTSAATAVVSWLATDPTGSGNAKYLVIGDLNSYDKEDPISALLDAGYTDLINLYLGEYAYSYAFDGQFGYLDHALASADLLDSITGTTVWHINSDEPDVLDYNTDFKPTSQQALYAADVYRSSDHDPVIIGFDLNAPPVCSQAHASKKILWPPNHKFQSIKIRGISDPDSNTVTIRIDSIFQDEQITTQGSGHTSPDGKGIGARRAKIRAERSSHGNGRVYHIGFTAQDSHGDSCSGVVNVSVPKHRKSNAIDGGPLYNSTH